MVWFDIFGIFFICIIMIPNIVYTIKYKEGFINKWNNRIIKILEQVGRFGCFGFMIIKILGTWFGWWSDEAFAVYLIISIILVLCYCIIWFVYFNENNIFRAFALSIIPSLLFLFSGIMSRYILLIVASIIFAPCHIYISYMNAKMKKV